MSPGETIVWQPTMGVLLMSDVLPAQPGRAAEGNRSLVPRTRVGWVATVLGFGVIAALVLTVVLLSLQSGDGETSGPPWVKGAFLAGTLAITVPAVWTGVIARRTDRSTLGSVAFWMACVVGGWFTFAGVVGLFFE